MQKYTYTDPATDDEVTVTLPTRWAICDCCRGDGHHAQHLGEFDAERMADHDEEWIEDYYAGRFDRPCTDCGGTGKVQLLDVPAMTFKQKRATVMIRAEQRAEAQYRAESARLYRAETGYTY